MHSRAFKRFALFGLATATLIVASPQAEAACAVSLGSGVANSQNRAIARAKQDALGKTGQNSGSAPISNMDFGEPACLYLDDGTNRIKCDIQLSFCTQPPLPPRPQVDNPNAYKPNIPNAHKRPKIPGGGQCSNFSTQAQASSLNRAKTAVVRAMSRALRDRMGIALTDPRVSGAEPVCYYLDNGTNAAVCKMTARVCG